MGRGKFDRGHRLNGRDESISPAWQCLYKTWAVRGVAEGFAQPHHGIVEAMIEVAKGVTRPETIPQVFPGDEVSRFFQEHREDLKGLLGELETQTVFAQFAGSQIRFEHTKANS